MFAHCRVLIVMVALWGIACTRDDGIAPRSDVAQVRFAAQPANSVAGADLSVTVELLGPDGSRASGASDSIHLTLSGNGTTSVIGSTLPDEGVATFPDLKITKVATYQLTASAAGHSTVSNAFTVVPGSVSAATSTLTVEPENPTPGLPTAVTFAFRDMYSNPIAAAPVRLGASLAGATLTPSEGVSDAIGSFATTLQSLAGSVSLSATVGSTDVTFASAVPVAPPGSLRFVVAPPASRVAGQPFSLTVEILNTLGRRIDGAADSITLALNGSAALLGRTAARALRGLAVFPDLTVLKSGSAYAVTANGSGLSVVSPTFVVGHAPPDAGRSKVRFSSAVVANLATDATFTIRDAFDNPVASAPVNLASSVAGATFTPSSGTTDANGAFVSSFRSPVSGLTPISVTAAGVQWMLDPPLDALPPQSISTDSVVAIGFASAQLTSTVMQNGTPYSTWFEWSRNPAFDIIVKSDAQAGPPPQCPVAGPCFVKAPATGLIPNTPYYYRSALSDALGTVRGEARGFTTAKGGQAPVLTEIGSRLDPLFPGPCPNVPTQEVIFTFHYTDADGDVIPTASSLSAFGINPPFGPNANQPRPFQNWRLDSIEGDGKAGNVQLRYCRGGLQFNITLSDNSGNTSNVAK